MASDLVNLTDKAAKLSIEPLFNTNWSDMPDDIKLECIGKMEFKERLSLRSTAKAERSLVDSQKIKFNYGHFWADYKCLAFGLYHNNKKYFATKCSEDISDVIEMFRYIKKIGVFEKLIISVNSPLLADNKQFMTDDELFTAKNIEFNVFNRDQVVAVLRKMKNGVESIKINSTLSNELGQILEIPLVQNVPYWHIRDYHHTDSVHKVAQMWIDKNSKIGFTFQFSVHGENGSSEKFFEQFADRIMSTSEKRVRIRTNNPDRHILLERGLDDVFTIYQYFRIMVISAEMKESEYDDNCKEWICKIDPVLHFMYYSDYNHGR
ncbi:hypothetical protein B9Z55_012915 [Caenorhabditis nigoni]|uniref:F-box domain-containing protein n=1 Tax=Caenorhabditis nigoni TaxID=1611254 RepID=A0A2G5TZI4_9PELO|nr:hypothetical protein B9Z55_012915 [Caenorhabditis nigoni]